MKRPRHAISVDVEDWDSGVLEMFFGVRAQPRAGVVDQTLRLRDLFDEHGVRATWFILGVVAESYPDLVRRLGEDGNELGIHGHRHVPVYSLSREEFREQTLRARNAVEQAGGKAVLGYRAPTFSINDTVPWAFSELASLGLSYDSSIFPFNGRRYGAGNAPLEPYTIDTENGPIREVPMTVLRLGPLRIPCSGGGYLRHLPFWWTDGGLGMIERQGRSAVLYLHPYEPESRFDREVFSDAGNGRTSLRFRVWKSLQYRNRHTVLPKLEKLLRRYSFGPIADVFEIGVSR